MKQHLRQRPAGLPKGPGPSNQRSGAGIHGLVSPEWLTAPALILLGLALFLPLAVFSTAADTVSAAAGHDASAVPAAAVTWTEALGRNPASRAYPRLVKTPPPAPLATPAPRPSAAPLQMAGVLRADLAVYDRPPPQGRVTKTLPAIDGYGERSVVRALRAGYDRQGERWLEVLLPTPPNETRGWVRASGLDLSPREYDILVDLSDHTLQLRRDAETVATYQVAVGTSGTPTPQGEFFVTVHVPNPGGAYGALALGLSAYSEVLKDWPGGGQAAIHGTNRPDLIGNSVSHGCIRMTNAAVLEVGKLAPVGTPVRIVP